jgi:hypothetical protein
MKPDLTVLYEHPPGSGPCSTRSNRAAIGHEAIGLSDHSFDPAARDIPAPVVLSRVAMSGFVREPSTASISAQALLAHGKHAARGVLNGTRALAIDCSKARQVSLISALGHGNAVDADRPSARVFRRPRTAWPWPLLVKPNVGGSARRSGAIPTSPSSNGRSPTAPRRAASTRSSSSRITCRRATAGSCASRPWGGRFLYAIEVETGGGQLRPLPGRRCLAQPGRSAVRMSAVTPDPALVEAAERIAAAAGLDVGGHRGHDRRPQWRTALL